MRSELEDASLARYAGRFVWLDLDFDKPENRDFLVQHAVANTPTFFILDPRDQRIAATEISAMTLGEFTRFLERGEQAAFSRSATPAQAALTQGDRQLAGHQHALAAASYREALRLAPPGSAEHNRAAAALTGALKSDGQWQSCAETAAAQAPGMKRDAAFGRVLVAGMLCVNAGEPEAWAEASARTLGPLAEEALTLPTTVRDHRFQLYQNLMELADAHHDKAGVERWGDRWLKELDATQPASDDERSALDIARVDAESVMGRPERVLPALKASERAMPGNYNASLRLAQMEVEAGHYDDAVSACDRGLQHVTGPLGTAWLLEVKADALTREQKIAEARRTLEDARRSAAKISLESPRKNNLAKITKALRQLPGAGGRPEQKKD